VEAYLANADVPPLGDVLGLMAPHAGLMFSGPVGAHAYKAVAGREYDVVFLVGPSHFMAFDGVSVWAEGQFDSPLGPALIDHDAAEEVLSDPVARAIPEAHKREHSLEMQLPFLRTVLPQSRIVPMLMGFQRRETIDAVAALLARVARGKRALLAASTDLSHYFDAKQAGVLDSRVRDLVRTFNPDGLLQLFEQYPEPERGRYVACGGGPAIAVMKAARELGATDGRVLKYAHSGEVSGDYDGVVGYLAAAFGRFSHAQ
jgi:AmmeMemoRadiSam system protein B